MPRLLDEIAASWRGRGETLGLGRFLLLLAISALAAFVLARLYVRFFGGRATGSDVHRSFPLLAIAVTSIFVCIQFSLPLSLGLLGALSIVRFRTPIKEPEEIGFIMLVIALSIAIATFKLAFAGLIFVIAFVALVVQASLRVEEVFWRVAVKPGKPVAFGTRGATLVFGLPGNPVSSLVGFELFVRPAARALQGAREPLPVFDTAELASPLRRGPGRDELVRSEVRDGVAEPLPGQESHMIVRAARANALVHVPRGEGTLEAGSRVRYLRLG